jgi:hypothetical protein
MSLAIDVDRVREVLLADGWHVVVNESFDIDAYEYLHADHMLLGGGDEPLLPARGFTFDELSDGGLGRIRISGPLTAVLAVREKVAE